MIPPQKSLQVHPPPTPQVTPRVAPMTIVTSGETTNFGGNIAETPPIINPPNPPFQIDLTLMQNLLAQGISTTLAAYKAAWNETFRNNRNGGGIPSVNQNNSKYCSYKDFMACKPQNFFGMEGIVSLSRWIDKTDAMFHISSCTEDFHVKYATCTQMDSALNWWNNHA